jgi:hypothetical protein
MKNNKKFYSVALKSAAVILFFIFFTSTAAAVLGYPSITSISPNQGPIGTEVTIKGFNFTGVTDVDFGGYPSKYLVISDSEIKADAPAAHGTVIIEVINSLHQSNGPQVAGTYTYTDGGSIVPTPTSTSTETETMQKPTETETMKKPTETPTQTETQIKKLLENLSRPDVIVAIVAALSAIIVALIQSKRNK